MTIYYVKDSGSDSNTGLSDAQAFLTPGKGLSVAGSNDKVLLKCGSVFRLSGTTGLSFAHSGSSTASLAVLGAYYLDSGTETEGVSGNRPQVKGDFAGEWIAGATVVSGDYYSIQHHDFQSGNGWWYRALNSGTFGSTPPVWPTVSGATVVSGNVTLQTVGNPTGGHLNQNSAPMSFNAIITPATGVDNIEIKDIRFSNWRGRGPSNVVNSSTYPCHYSKLTNLALDTIQNRAFYWGNNQNTGIEYVFDHLVVTNCEKGGYDAQWGAFSSDGGGASGALWSLKGPYDITKTRILKNCIMSGNWGEGIVGGCNLKVYDNIFHASRGPYLYVIADAVSVCRGNEMYRNIILGSTDSAYWRYSTGYCGWAIAIANETAGSQALLENKAYNNLIAFCRYAFYIGDPAKGPSATFQDSDFVFNTCIDNQTPGVIFGGDQGGAGSNIKNNIFYNYTSGLTGMGSTTYGSKHINFDYNLWNDTTLAGGAAGAHDVYADPGLHKKSGWTSILNYGDVSAADFRPDTGSPAIGAGVTISGYTLDYNGGTRTSPPSIGAWDTVTGGAGGGGGGTSTTPSAYVSDNRYNQGSVGTYSVSAPGNLLAGNLILLFLSTKNSSATSGSNFTLPSGFTLGKAYRSATASTFRPEMVVAYKEAVAGDIGATFTGTATIDWGAATVRIDGHKTGDPIDLFGTGADSDSTGVTSLALPSITTTAANSLVISTVSIRGVDNTFNLSTEEVLVYFPTSGLNRGQGATDALQATAGATGSKTMNWTTSGRACGFQFAIKAGTVATDILPPVTTAGPSVSSKTDTSVTVGITLTDATTSNIKLYGTATRLAYPAPNSAQVIAGQDGNGLTAMSANSKLTIASGVADTLTLSSLTDPKVRLSLVAKDNSAGANIQSFPAVLVVLLNAPTGYSYTEVAIDSGATANSFLAGKVYGVGDVMVYQSATSPDGLPVSVDGSGNVTITRGGNIEAQTFAGYLWSPSTGATQDYLFQDPFYQADIGPFGNSTDTLITGETVYVKFALHGEALTFIPTDPTLDPDAQAVTLNQATVINGVSYPNTGGILYHTDPGDYTIIAQTADGAYIGMQEVTIA